MTDYDRAVQLVGTEGRAGASFLKQRLLLSDSKVQRLLKQMESAGVVSRPGAGGAREVLCATKVPTARVPGRPT